MNSSPGDAPPAGSPPSRAGVSVFRQGALDRISSPEQLDHLLRFPSPPGRNAASVLRGLAPAALARLRAGWRRAGAPRGLPGRIETPTVLQMEATECGAACLAVVLAYFGRWVTLEELRLACGVSRNGSRAANVLRAAGRYGLQAQAFKSEPETLRRLAPPMILHWRFNHFVVLEGFAKGRVYLNDPALGPVTVSERELDESFTGVALRFVPGPDFVRQGRKPSFLPALFRRLGGSWLIVAAVLLAGLALMGPRLVAPTFPRLFVDRVLLSARPGWLAPLLGAMVGTALLLGLLTWLQQRLLLRLETRLAVEGSSRLLRHILRLPMEFFTQRHTGDITSRLPVSNRVAELLSRELATNLLSASMVVFFALLMLRYDALLTAIVVLAAALNVAALRHYSRRRSDGNRRLRQEQGMLQGAVMGGIERIETVKSTGSESDLFVRWAGYQAKVVNLRQQLEHHTQMLELVPPLLAALSTACVLGIGSRRVIAGTLTMGQLVAFQALLAAFLAPISRLVGLAARLQTAEGDVVRLEDVLRYPAEPGPVETTVRAGGRGAARLAGGIELAGVCFGYDRSEPPLIQGFDVRIGPGERVALVGPSGSGKTTIARLVLGLYQPWSGEIRFDGERRGELPRAVLVGSLASVDQSIALFEGTVRENLTLWDPTVPLADVIAAARDAAIHDEIMARPGGYDGPVEEDGRNWSGGQRQRLEIARALVGRPAILILDEATSALDPTTEEQIDRNLRRRGCTCLLVAHRLSTIRDASEILVLDQGRIVQRGTHEQLKDREGPYARLIDAQ